jgi:hypothetical protein
MAGLARTLMPAGLLLLLALAVLVVGAIAFRLSDSEPDWLRVGVALLVVVLVALATLYALVRFIVWAARR